MEIKQRKGGILHFCFLDYESITDVCYNCGSQDHKYDSCVLNSTIITFSIENVEVIPQVGHNIISGQPRKSPTSDAIRREACPKHRQINPSVRNLVRSMVGLTLLYIRPRIRTCWYASGYYAGNDASKGGRQCFESFGTSKREGGRVKTVSFGCFFALFYAWHLFFGWRYSQIFWLPRGSF